MLFHRSVFGVSLGALICFANSVWAAPARIVVLGLDAKPLAGASVRVLERLDYSKELPTRDLVTDANGAVTLEIDEAKTPRHSYRARVLAPGFAVAGGNISDGETKFQLQAGQSWGGVVLGEDEKPLAGVKVAVREFRVAGQSTFLGSDDLASQTDATGRWKIDNLPLLGTARVAIADPRYEAQSFDLPLSKTSAPPLFVRPGAALRGRMVKPDGTPIVGAQVSSWGVGIESVVTDAQGRFSIAGFAPGEVRLSSFNLRPARGKATLPADYVVIPQKIEALKRGETRDIGDWTAQNGILVSGQVIDKATKKPISGAQVMLYDAVAASSSHATDEAGRYQVRLSDAGARSGYISSQNHLTRNLNSLSIPKDAATFEMPTLELEPGVRVAGMAKREDGEAFDGGSQPFSLTATGSGEFKPAGGQSDGSFSFGALAPGKYTLAAGLPSNYGGQTNRFTLVSPPSFTVPPAGEEMAPLSVLLKLVAGAAKPPTRLTGRVTDDKGRGVAGVVVSLQRGNFSNPILAVSGEDGTYEISDLASDGELSVVGVERPGYVAARAPQVEREGETWRVIDTVIQRRGARFVGRVVDAEGKPVAGALIAPLELEKIEPVKSAADGTFTLLDLPAGDFTLLAAKDRLSATQKTGVGAQNVELKLAPPAPIDTAPLLEKWIARSSGWWASKGANAEWGVERMEQLTLKGAPDQPVSAGAARFLAWFIRTASTNEPAWTRQNATRLLERFPLGTEKRTAESVVALLRAESADAADQDAAQAWLKRENAEAGGITLETVNRYLAMAGVARALKRPEADGLLDFAAQIADQLPASTRLSNAMNLGTQIAPFGETAVAAFIEDWDATARLPAWGGAAQGFAKTGEIEAARRALKTLETLSLVPAIRAATNETTGVRYYENSTNMTPALVIQGARGALVRALSERDPAAALAESALMSDNSTRRAAAGSNFAQQNALLWVANGARLRGDKAVATKALRQVFEFNIGNTEPFALAAWYGAQIDPALGEELFAKARARVTREPSFGAPKSLGDVAYYLARLDPAQSRILVEREWNQRTPTFGQKTDDYGASNGATKLVRAMLVIDPARGAQMATQLETAEAGTRDAGGQRGRERTGWISALLADAAAQARGDLEARS